MKIRNFLFVDGSVFDAIDTFGLLFDRCGGSILMLLLSLRRSGFLFCLNMFDMDSFRKVIFVASRHWNVRMRKFGMGVLKRLDMCQGLLEND